MPIDDDFRQLTAMLMPIGIYLYNVLTMGLSNATDIFEACMRDIVDGSRESSILQMTFLSMPLIMMYLGQMLFHH